MPNPFDQFDTEAQPVPVQALRPIVGNVSPEEQERKAREEQRDVTRLDVTLESEQRAASKDQFDRISTYRKEFLTEPTVRQFREVENATRQIVELAKKESEQPGPADIALIISYMKALDPGSVVRETEFATAENAGGVPETIRNAYNKLLNGGRLTPEIKREFAQTAVSIYNARRGGYNSFAEDYRGLVTAEGADPDAQGIRLAEPIEFDDPRQSPLAASGGQREEISGTSETFLTEADRRLQAALTSAYERGANLQELQAISAEFNRPFPITTQEDLDAARAQGRKINVEPSGVRSEAGKLIGAAADSPVGAGFIGAANALLSGGLDEIAPFIGGDAATVQAAKEALRERYPVSSFVGEVGGQAGQLAVGGAGLRALGLGTRALAGAEIAQGAAYGAGESNDNRLAGAALGAGGTVVGQQIAQRLLAPQARQVLERIAGENNVPVEEVERAVADAFEAAPRQAPAAPAASQVDELTAPSLTQGQQEELGTLAQQALKRGKAGRDAQAKLAVMAQIDPEAKAAAESLGIELPVDVLSNDARLLTVSGLARSQIGSDAQAAWGQTVSQAIQKSDDTLRAIGATNDLAQVSADIRDRLLKDMSDLEAQATALRTEVTDAINVRDRVEASSLQAQLAQTINDLGGIDEAKQAFSAEEKKLLAMLGEGETANRPTYARLNQIRDQIGRALFKGQGPWVDAPTATLKRYYGALADDQIAYVESVGGKELADKMRGSNDLYSQMFKARESMQTVYGKSLEEDIGPLINRAITSGSKGDAGALRQLIAAVPEDMQSRALLSGIFAQVDRGSAQGGFSFAKYANIYQGLRKNSPVYAEIARTVGPEGERILRDLYSVSKRMAVAESKIVRTGASTQPLLNALNAEGLIGKLAGATARVGTKVAGATVGGVTGGPAGAFIGQEVAGGIEAALTKGGKSRLDKLHNVLVSEPFKDLVEKVGNGTVKPAEINRTANDKAFRRFAASVLGIRTFEGRKNWLQAATTASATTQTRPAEQQTSVIEVR